jgi:GNAT superfamily N-acetyltransferase
VEIVRYEPRLLGQVVALQRRVWSPDESLNAAYFRWKHECNPYFRQPKVFLAVERGRAIAMRGFVGSQWETGSGPSPVVLPMAADSSVAPEHEGAGVMNRLMQHALRELGVAGHAWVLNLSASPVTLLASLAAGWRATTSLAAMQTPWVVPGALRWREQLRRIPLLWRLRLESLPIFETRDEREPFSSLDRYGPARLAAVSARLSLRRQPPLDAMLALIDRAGQDGRCRHVRDRAWLEWRLADPLTAYRFVCWEDRQLEGYAVLAAHRSRNMDRLQLTIADLEARDPEVAERLLAGIVAACQTRIVAWRHGLPAIAAPALAPLGFRDRPAQGGLGDQRPCVLLKSLRPDESPGFRCQGLDLLDRHSWDLRPLYSN